MRYRYDDILTAVRETADGWKGWEWPHDPGGVVREGPGPQDDWDVWEASRRAGIEESGEEDVFGDALNAEDVSFLERVYGEECQVDAEGASSLMIDVIAAIHCDDLHAALVAAESAAALEMSYGDCPTYRGVVEAIKAALATQEDE